MKRGDILTDDESIANAPAHSDGARRYHAARKECMPVRKQRVYSPPVVFLARA